MSTALPALSLPELHGSGYPEPFKSRMGDRVKRRLGAAFGLTQFGVNLVVLGPGGQSALRHWHTLEDEFVYVLEGELVLVSNAGEQLLRAGDCAGYPAGQADGHHLLNRSQTSARYLEMGSRQAGDVAFYPDDDLMLVPRAQDGTVALAPAHKDGRGY
ncbi:MAG: cupin domain-containing protein [Pseudomonadota bacterium]